MITKNTLEIALYFLVSRILQKCLKPLKNSSLRHTKAVNLQADMTRSVQGPGMLQSGQRSFHYESIWMVPIMKLCYFKIHFTPNTNTAANMWQPTEVLSQLFG